MELGNYIRQYHEMQVYLEGHNGAYLDKYPLFPVVEQDDLDGLEEEEDEGMEHPMLDFEPQNKYEVRMGVLK